MPTLSVIIVNYNTREMTLRCLETLYAALEGIDSEVFVVDNASADGSVEAIGRTCPAVNIIANETNLGFGAANNQALQAANGEYFLLLNSDAFPRPDAIHRLLQLMASRPDVGVLGPKLLNRDGSLQRSCWRFPSPGRSWMECLGLSALLRSHPSFGDYRGWAHDEERTVDFVIGACLLVRRAVYEQVGGFDPRFFMYAEETDWQLRVTRAGWRIVFSPVAEVTHEGGASSETPPDAINPHFFHSADLYIHKHHGLPGLVSMRAASGTGAALRMLGWSAIAFMARGKRGIATAKARFNAKLCARQLASWPVVAK